MGLSIENAVPAIAVFLQGILSFLSPCVLPLVPLYIGYLSGGTKKVSEDGTITFDKNKVIVNTLFFIIGISFAFFILGFGFSAAGRYLNSQKMLFTRIGGIIIILFGLFQLGLFGSTVLSRERRLPIKLNTIAMNPFTALLLGFTFSFAWTPCVGPALTSVLLMASSSASALKGFILIGVYTIGFVIPFMIVGIFAGTMLNILKKHTGIVKYTVKIGGIIMILMGIMMLTGWINGITGYLSSYTNKNSVEPPKKTEETIVQETTETESNENTENQSNDKILPAPDFTLTDQYGNTHKLSDYKGKVVFLNFWATWCKPCQIEMPEIQAAYEKYGENSDDVIVLGIANPRTEESPYNQDVPEDEIVKMLDENNFSYPVVMDTTGEIFMNYGISSFPTTFMIDKDGNVFGYVSGSLSGDIIDNIINQTISGKRS